MYSMHCFCRSVCHFMFYCVRILVFSIARVIVCDIVCNCVILCMCNFCVCNFVSEVSVRVFLYVWVYVYLLHWVFCSLFVSLRFEWCVLLSMWTYYFIVLLLSVSVCVVFLWLCMVVSTFTHTYTYIQRHI